MATGKPFLNSEEERVLVKTIREAERYTTGEIVVHIVKSLHRQDPLKVARKHFVKLGIHKTKYRNGVLILIAERDRKLACLGDQGIHEKVTGDFWTMIVKNLEKAFRKDEALVGLTQAVAEIGNTLAKYFPITENASDNPNELSDEISHSDE